MPSALEQHRVVSPALLAGGVVNLVIACGGRCELWLWKKGGVQSEFLHPSRALYRRFEDLVKHRDIRT